MGTITVSIDSVIVWIMAIAMIYGLLRFIARREKQKSEKYAAERSASEALHKERELQQKRDHQLNHGRRVYNWLVKEIQKHQDPAILVSKIEDNGGSFSICIDRKDDGVMQGRIPILQLSYDFVRYEDPFIGHIHYGAYGADILIWARDYAPFHGLDQLVLKVVEENVRRPQTVA